MIRRCDQHDFEAIYAIVNAAALAYRGVIPADCWTEPYMPREELREEIGAGVVFWRYEEGDALAGVMGIQHVQDVTLIRHAYVRAASQRRGIGAALLASLHAQTERPVLVGTWSDAGWAVRFYEKHGFQLVSPEEKDRLLRRYWTVSERRIETSVVLADPAWFDPLKREAEPRTLRWAARGVGSPDVPLRARQHRAIAITSRIAGAASQRDSTSASRSSLRTPLPLSVPDISRQIFARPFPRCGSRP
jgi:GNAT superfamily N-acetyltransferase